MPTITIPQVLTGNRISVVTPLGVVPTPIPGKFVADGGTLALYHFDDGSGSSAADSSGGAPMVLAGTPTWLSGDGGNTGWANPQKGMANGSAVQFNGSSQYGTVAGLLDTIPPAGFTVAFWLRLDATPTSNWFVSKFTSSTQGFGLYSQGSSLNLFYSTPAFGTIFSTKSSFSNGRWYHVVMTGGPGGLQLWIDGCAEARNPALTALPATSGPSPFTIGAYNNSGVSDYAECSIDELIVLNRQASRSEILCLVNRRRYVPLVAEGDRWNVLGSVFSPTNSWNAGINQEPWVVVRSPTLAWMFYTGGYSSSGIGYATSPDGVTWTDQTPTAPLIGLGHGGEANQAAHFSFATYYGTDYLFYQQTTGSGAGAWSVATAPAGSATYATQAVAIAAGSSVLEGLLTSIDNTFVLSPAQTFDGKWRMVATGPVSGGSYGLAAFYATNPLGPWTMSPAALITSLTPGTGFASIYSIIQVGDRFEAWYEWCNEGDQPTYVSRATTYDGTLATWTPDPFAPFMSVADFQGAGGASGVDQTGTPFVISFAGKCFLYMCLVNNSIPGSYIGAASFAGTPDQLTRRTYWG